MTGAIFISDNLVILDTPSLQYKKCICKPVKQWKLLYYLSNFFIILQTSNDKCNHQVESFMALSKWAPPTPGCLLFIKSFQSNYQHHTTHPLEEIKSTLKKHSISKKERPLAFFLHRKQMYLLILGNMSLVPDVETRKVLRIVGYFQRRVMAVHTTQRDVRSGSFISVSSIFSI